MHTNFQLTFARTHAHGHSVGFDAEASDDEACLQEPAQREGHHHPGHRPVPHRHRPGQAAGAAGRRSHRHPGMLYECACMQGSMGDRVIG